MQLSCESVTRSLSVSGSSGQPSWLSSTPFQVSGSSGQVSSVSGKPSPSRSPRLDEAPLGALLRRALRERCVSVRLGDLEVPERVRHLPLAQVDARELELRAGDRELAGGAFDRAVPLRLRHDALEPLHAPTQDRPLRAPCEDDRERRKRRQREPEPRARASRSFPTRRLVCRSCERSIAFLRREPRRRLRRNGRRRRSSLARFDLRLLEVRPARSSTSYGASCSAPISRASSTRDDAQRVHGRRIEDAAAARRCRHSRTRPRGRDTSQSSESASR